MKASSLLGEQINTWTESVIKYLKSNKSELEEGEIYENSRIETNGHTKYQAEISYFEPIHNKEESIVTKNYEVVKVETDNYKQSKIDSYEIDTTCAIESFPEAVNSVFKQDPIFVSKN